MHRDHGCSSPRTRSSGKALLPDGTRLVPGQLHNDAAEDWLRSHPQLKPSIRTVFFAVQRAGWSFASRVMQGLAFTANSIPVPRSLHHTHAKPSLTHIPTVPSGMEG